MRVRNLSFVPVPSREAVVGSSAVAPTTREPDAGSKSLDFVPVPGRETLMGSFGVAAATHGTDAGSKSRFRTGTQSRNSHGFSRCGRSYSRIHSSDVGPCAPAK